MRRLAFALSGWVVLFAACSGKGTFGLTDDVGNEAGTDVDGGSTEGGALDGTVFDDGSTFTDAPPGDGTINPNDAIADSPADAPGTDAKVDASVDAGACPAGAPTVPALKIVDVTSSTMPSAFFAAQPPGSNDWYVVEQGGRVRIIRAGALLSTPFLDISAAMGTNFGERGLLSIAFHPNYAANGRFFVMGTPADSNDGTFSATNADAVVEFKRDPNDADLAIATKVQDIVVLPASDTNHNGGTIMFGPDNFLYVATGDGGGGCESSKPGQVQDTTKLFGKVLRLDVNGSAPFAAAGNPFANDTRVYHYGLRNPFRFNFDPLTGDLFIGDVGQDSYEEISVAVGNVAGKNFGWPAYEGAVQGTCGAGKVLGGPSPYTAPIVSIDRRGGSASPFADYSSIIGGRVYRGTAIPGLAGIYLFADFAGTEVGAIRYCNGTVHGPVAIPMSSIPTPTGTLSTVSSFAQGHDGELYVTYGYGSARLGKIVAQ